MENTEKKEKKQQIIDAVLASIAVISAILSLAFGEINTSSIFGCIKDVAGTSLVIIVLFMMRKPKVKGNFRKSFYVEMEELSRKYNPLLSPLMSDSDAEKANASEDHDKEPEPEPNDSQKEKDDILTYFLATDLDAFFRKSTGKRGKFFELNLDKSTITFFLNKSTFSENAAAVCDGIFSAIDKAYNYQDSEIKLSNVAKIATKKVSGYETISVEFTKDLNGEDDAKYVAQIIDFVIFCYNAKYRGKPNENKNPQGSKSDRRLDH